MKLMQIFRFLIPPLIILVIYKLFLFLTFNGNCYWYGTLFRKEYYSCAFQEFVESHTTISVLLLNCFTVLVIWTFLFSLYRIFCDLKAKIKLKKNDDT